MLNKKRSLAIFVIFILLITITFLYNSHKATSALDSELERLIQIRGELSHSEYLSELQSLESRYEKASKINEDQLKKLRLIITRNIYSSTDYDIDLLRIPKNYKELYLFQRDTSAYNTQYIYSLKPHDLYSDSNYIDTLKVIEEHILAHIDEYEYEHLSSLYVQMSIVFIGQDLKEETIKILDDILQLESKHNILINSFSAYINKGNIYLGDHEMIKAKEQFLNAYSLMTNQGMVPVMAQELPLYYNLSYLYSFFKNSEKSNYFSSEGLALINQSPCNEYYQVLTFHRAMSYHHLAEDSLLLQTLLSLNQMQECGKLGHDAIPPLMEALEEFTVGEYSICLNILESVITKDFPYPNIEYEVKLLKYKCKLAMNMATNEEAIANDINALVENNSFYIAKEFLDISSEKREILTRNSQNIIAEIEKLNEINQLGESVNNDKIDKLQKLKESSLQVTKEQKIRNMKLLGSLILIACLSILAFVFVYKNNNARESKLNTKLEHSSLLNQSLKHDYINYLSRIRYQLDSKSYDEVVIQDIKLKLESSEYVKSISENTIQNISFNITPIIIRLFDFYKALHQLPNSKISCPSMISYHGNKLSLEIILENIICNWFKHKPSEKDLSLDVVTNATKGSLLEFHSNYKVSASMTKHINTILQDVDDATSTNSSGLTIIRKVAKSMQLSISYKTLESDFLAIVIEDIKPEINKRTE